MLAKYALVLACVAACDRVLELEEVPTLDGHVNDTTLSLGRRPGGWGDKNLSDEGSLDWVHWALGAKASAINRKAGVAPLVTDVMRVRGSLVGMSTSTLGTMSWTDGEPTQMASGSQDYLQLESSVASGDGFELQISAGEPRTAILYAGSFCVTSTLEATLGDKVAMATAGEDLAGTAYAIDFASATGGVLTLRFTVSSNPCTTGDTGELWLVAVTVAPSQ